MKIAFSEALSFILGNLPMKNAALGLVMLLSSVAGVQAATVQLTAKDVLYTVDSLWASRASIVADSNTIWFSLSPGTLHADSENKEEIYGADAVPVDIWVSARSGQQGLSSFTALVEATFTYSGDFSYGYGYARNDLTTAPADGQSPSFAQVRLDALDGSITDSGQPAVLASPGPSAHLVATLSIWTDVSRRVGKDTRYAKIAGDIDGFGVDTSLVSSVPEPRVWSMLLAGLILAQAATVRRRSV